MLWFKKGINPSYLAGIQLISDQNVLIFESEGLNEIEHKSLDVKLSTTERILGVKSIYKQKMHFDL